VEDGERVEDGAVVKVTAERTDLCLILLIRELGLDSYTYRYLK
jgi:hypothetical protein